MTCLYKETQQDMYWSLINRGAPIQVILIRKSLKESKFDFKLPYNKEWPKELLGEPRGILQNKKHSIFYINPKLNLSVSVPGQNFYFLKAENNNWHKQTTDRKGPGNT